MVQTRRQSLVAAGGEVPLATPSRTPAKSRAPSRTPPTNGKNGKSKDWASSHGTGDRSGAWGLSGTLGQLVSVGGTLFIIGVTPIFAILM